MSNGAYPCPVCGKSTFSASGSFEICKVCGWEDDNVQFRDSNFRGGANCPSLTEARENYLRSGIHDDKTSSNVKSKKPLP